MAAIERRFIVAKGPIKFEILLVNTVAASESITSSLVRPMCGLMQPIADQGGASITTSAQVQDFIASGSQNGLQNQVLLQDPNDLITLTNRGLVLLIGF